MHDPPRRALHQYQSVEVLQHTMEGVLFPEHQTKCWNVAHEAEREDHVRQDGTQMKRTVAAFNSTPLAHTARFEPSSTRLYVPSRTKRQIGSMAFKGFAIKRFLVVYFFTKEEYASQFKDYITYSSISTTKLTKWQ